MRVGGSNQFQQPGKPDRFLQYRDPERAGPLEQCRVGKAGDEGEARQRRTGRFQHSDNPVVDLNAIHVRQAQVEQAEVEALGPDALERGGAGPGAGDGDSEQATDVYERLDEGAIIVNNQDVHFRGQVVDCPSGCAGIGPGSAVRGRGPGALVLPVLGSRV